jgi:hypothetical protein
MSIHSRRSFREHRQLMKLHLARLARFAEENENVD